jgi:hypothetical protein
MGTGTKVCVIMVKEEIKYFLCFHAGSHGRFVNLTIKSLLNNNFKKILNCNGEFNCWHREDFHDNSFQDNIFNSNSKDFYSAVKFPPSKYSYINDNKILTAVSIQTHLYPNWSVLNSRQDLDSAKFIIIKVNFRDRFEIHSNIIYKNYIRELMLGNDVAGISDRLNHLYSIFQNLYGKCSFDQFVHAITNDFDQAQELIKASYNDANWEINYKFINCEIDSEFSNRTLLINYRDLFIKSSTGYVALDKISEFFDVAVPEDAVNFFDFNNRSRQTLIQDCMYNLNIS